MRTASLSLLIGGSATYPEPGQTHHQTRSLSVSKPAELRKPQQYEIATGLAWKSAQLAHHSKMPGALIRTASRDVSGGLPNMSCHDD
jgi:hypothetical protein